jgi:hypothetical protein
LGKPNGTGDLRIGVGDGRGGRDRRSDGGGELGHARLLVVLEVAAQWPAFLAFALPGDGCSLSSGPRGQGFYVMIMGLPRFSAPSTGWNNKSRLSDRRR